MINRGDKRGLSQIVTVVLLLVLLLVGITIVWSVLQGVFISRSDKISLGLSTVKLEIQNVEINTSSNNVSIDVRRNSGKGDVAGLKFVFYTTGDSFSYNVNKSLNKIGRENFEISDVPESTFNFANTIRVGVAPILQTESGEEILGDVLDDSEDINKNCLNFTFGINNPGPKGICIEANYDYETCINLPHQSFFYNDNCFFNNGGTSNFMTLCYAYNPLEQKYNICLNGCQDGVCK